MKFARDDSVKILLVPVDVLFRQHLHGHLRSADEHLGDAVSGGVEEVGDSSNRIMVEERSKSQKCFEVKRQILVQILAGTTQR